ncbi:MAG: DUF349 domain-containing protein [Crocinitomicaceae bacterium]
MKVEIIARLNELAHLDKVLDAVNEFNELTAEFQKLQEEEEHAFEVQKLERIEAGEKPENIEKPVYEYMDDFKRLSQLFKDKKKIEVNAQKDIENANLEKKRALIAALTDLIQNEENIGRAIARFKDIQDSWKEIGAVPREKRQDVQKEFSNLVENFRYNINIYKDIKDHDLNRNLSLKKELLDKLKALLDVEIIKDIEEKLHAIQDEWNAIGGTHQEEWEKIKGEYWDTVNKVYEKIHSFYKSRREERSENITKKKELIEKARSIVEKEITSHKAWKKLTDKLVALQEEWKTVGYGPKEENNAVWKEFRAICNDFFAKKKDFYGDRNDQFDGVKEAKENMIKEVESLKNSTDWGNTTKQIVAIQKKWKDVGSAGPKHENRLWKEFRDHIDYFFDQKEAHFKNADAAGTANLKAKEEVIKKIQGYKVPADGNKAVQELKEFSSQFAEIGNVPFKEKDRIYKAYKKALDEKYDAIQMDQSEKERLIFESRLDSIKGSDDPERDLDRERSGIRNKLNKLKSEIVKMETNMAFFANADENNPLMKSAIKSLNDAKAEEEALKEQLKAIRILEQAIEREQAEEEMEDVEATEGGSEDATPKEETNE